MANERMKRQPNVTWMPPNEWQYINLQVLMDIRDELQKLNSLLHCNNVVGGFRALSRIARRDEKSFKRRVDDAVAKRVKRAAA